MYKLNHTMEVRKLIWSFHHFHWPSPSSKFQIIGMEKKSWDIIYIMIIIWLVVEAIGYGQNSWCRCVSVSSPVWVLNQWQFTWVLCLSDEMGYNETKDCAQIPGIYLTAGFLLKKSLNQVREMCWSIVIPSFSVQWKSDECTKN